MIRSLSAACLLGALYRFAWPKGEVAKPLVDGAAFLRDPWYAKDGPAIPASDGATSPTPNSSPAAR